MAIKYFLYILDRFKDELTTEQIAFCLDRLGTVCYYHKMFDLAMQFRNALRVVYETQLLQLDVLERPVARPVDKTSVLPQQAEVC